ncbi:olfactory receptor 5H17-like [Dipodomys merriami]|uniref:olfactory receptor 5H17-like n=1 Tax=Dipodomys merriami TaxID=94247 RepID=UPI003855E605
MKKENMTVVTEFVLTGLTHQPQWKIPLFFFFFVVYLMTVLGNFSLIGLIWKDPHLHIPMYLCLGNLAFVDTWLSSTVTPNMLLNLLDKNKLISFSACLIQFFSFVISATAECFILAVMAYDRYVAICKPLLYPVIMTNKLCMHLLVLSYFGGLAHAVIHESFLFRLAFCKSNIIYHFYCDVIPLLKITCTDPSLNYLIIFIFSGSIQVFSIMTILISYTFILFTILTTKSEKGMRKAFSTCGAHLLSVSLYYGPLLFMYVHPASSQAVDKDMFLSLFYTVIVPVLNPIIYSLRNKQVIQSLKKLLKRNI